MPLRSRMKPFCSVMLAAGAMVWVSSTLTTASGQSPADSRLQNQIRQASLSSGSGIVAARLEASRATQIRVTVKFLLVDQDTRDQIYASFEEGTVTTSADKMPLSMPRNIGPPSGSSVEAVEVVRRPSLVSTCKMKRPEAETVMNLISQAPHSQVENQRSIIVLDGQDAEYSDIAQRPFVVGVDTSKNAESPIVQVLNEGTTVHVQAMMEQNAIDAPPRVQLRAEFNWQKIMDMTTEKVYGLPKEPGAVQVPTHRIKTAIATEQLASDQFLLIDPYLSRTTTYESEASVPVLKKLPYLGRSFKNKSRATVQQNVMVLLHAKME